MIDDTQDDAAVLGVIFEDDNKPEHFEVFPENWETITMWTRINTQWRVSMAGAVGLDYTVLRWLFELYEVRDQRELLENLQVMESAVLEYRARQAD